MALYCKDGDDAFSNIYDAGNSKRKTRDFSGEKKDFLAVNNSEKYRKAKVL